MYARVRCRADGQSLERSAATVIRSVSNRMAENVLRHHACHHPESRSSGQGLGNKLTPAIALTVPGLALLARWCTT